MVHAANGIALFEDMVNSKSPMLSSFANKKHLMVYYRYIWFKTLWNQRRNGIIKEIEKELPNGCRNIPRNILFNKLEHEICWDKYAKALILHFHFFNSNFNSLFSALIFFRFAYIPFNFNFINNSRFKCIFWTILSGKLLLLKQRKS